MQFLRVRKFRMNDAFQTFERMFLAAKRYPQFFEEDLENIMKMFHTGFCYPLSERDEEGRRIVFVQTKKFNPEDYSAIDSMRLFSYIMTVLLEEEETQIAGVVIVFDNDSATLKHFLAPLDTRDYMHFVKNCSTLRQKGNYIVNSPLIANFVLEIVRSVLSEKLKKRFFVLKSSIELRNYIKLSLLPKEFGGTKSEADMMQDFIKLRDQHQKKLSEFLGFKTDWSKVPVDKIWSNKDNETVGSFRKLEID